MQQSTTPHIYTMNKRVKQNALPKLLQLVTRPDTQLAHMFRRRFYGTIPFTELPFTQLVTDNRLDLFALWERYNKHNHKFNQLDANTAVGLGNITALEWLRKERSLSPEHWTTTLAARNGHLEMLQWLVPQYGAHTQCAENAACNGHLHILQWLKAQHLTDLHGCADVAAEHGHVDVLQYLYQHKRYCGFDIPSAMVRKGRVDVLLWLLRHPSTHCFVSDDELLEAADWGQLEVLQLLVEWGYQPNTLTVNYAASAGYLDMVQWCYQQGIQCDQNGVNALF